MPAGSPPGGPAAAAGGAPAAAGEGLPAAPAPPVVPEVRPALGLRVHPEGCLRKHLTPAALPYVQAPQPGVLRQRLHLVMAPGRQANRLPRPCDQGSMQCAGKPAAAANFLCNRHGVWPACSLPPGCLLASGPVFCLAYQLQPAIRAMLREWGPQEPACPSLAALLCRRHISEGATGEVTAGEVRALLDRAIPCNAAWDAAEAVDGQALQLKAAPAKAAHSLSLRARTALAACACRCCAPWGVVSLVPGGAGGSSAGLGDAPGPAGTATSVGGPPGVLHRGLQGAFTCAHCSELALRGQLALLCSPPQPIQAGAAAARQSCFATYE